MMRDQSERIEERPLEFPRGRRPRLNYLRTRLALAERVSNARRKRMSDMSLAGERKPVCRIRELRPKLSA